VEKDVLDVKDDETCESLGVGLLAPERTRVVDTLLRPELVVLCTDGLPPGLWF
jgi:hypothetical protein